VDKIHVIPNWTDEDLYRLVLPDQMSGAKRCFAGGFNVVFASDMGFA